MTIRELYEWAVEHGYEDYTVVTEGRLGEYDVDPSDMSVRPEWREVCV